METKPQSSTRRTRRESGPPITSQRKRSHTVNEERTCRFIQLLTIRQNHTNSKEWREISRWVKYEQDVDEFGRIGKPHIAPLAYTFISKLHQLVTNHSVILLDVAIPKEQHKDHDEVLADTFRNIVSAFLEKQLIDGAEGDGVLNDLMIFAKSPHSKEQRVKCSEALVQKSIPTQFEMRREESPDKINLSINLTRKGSIQVKKVTRQNSRKDKFLKRRQTFSNLFASDDNDSTVVPFSKDMESAIILLGMGYKTMGRKGAMAFVRFTSAISWMNCSNPIRFIIVILSPLGMDEEFTEIGKALGTLMSDPRFHNSVTIAKDFEEFFICFNDYLDRSIILPPGNWYTQNLCELLPVHVLEEKGDILLRTLEKCGNRKLSSFISTDDVPLSSGVLGIESDPFPSPYERQNKPFGGMMNDLKRKCYFYKSDFLDGINTQTFTTTIFLYFAAIAPNVTFGGLLEQKTNGLIGVSETLLAASISGIIFAVFGGQPLNVIAPTGPLLIFDEQLFQFSESKDIEFLTLRVWISLWVLVISVAVVALEGSALVKYFSRFTMESFSALSSLIFVHESFVVIYYIYVEHPPTTKISKSVENENLSNGSLTNMHTGQQPNTAMFSTFLMFGTFYVALKLNSLRHTVLFPKKIRELVADFGVPIAILLMVSIDIYVGDVYTTKTQVPSGLNLTSPLERGWFVPLFGRNKPFNYWLPLITIIPSALIFLIMFMTVEICEKLMLARGGLQKGCGLHWDPIVLGVTNLGCGILGLPWMSIAILRTFAHVSALKVYSKSDIPGTQPTVVKIRENRLSGLFMSILMGLSVFAAPVLKLVPIPVLFAVFLYMGVTSFTSTQLFDRIVLFFTSPDSHPQTVYVRKVRPWKIHLFTLIQIIILAVLWVVKSIKEIAIFFPLVLFLLPLVRMRLNLFFTNAELEALDEETPPIISPPSSGQ